LVTQNRQFYRKTRVANRNQNTEMGPVEAPAIADKNLSIDHLNREGNDAYH